MVRSANSMAWDLLDSADPGRFADFLEAFEESVVTAFIDADRRVPAKPADRPGVSARGNYRRWQLDVGFQEAANKAGVPVITLATSPPGWTFPIVRLGAFSITLGIVDRQLAQGRRWLRTKGAYMRRHASRNSVLDPQASLPFKQEKVKRILPAGAIGAVIVIEGSLYQPDEPRYIGFWIPSPNLTTPYFRVKLETLIESLRRRAASATPRKVVQGARIKPKRKLPVRKTPQRKNDDNR